MAATGTLSNPRLSGLPVIYTVHTTQYVNVTFQRVVAEVSVSETLSTTSETFRFSVPTTGGEDIDIDISSAVRAVADEHRYEPTEFSYPSYQIAIELYEEYLVDGIVHKVSGQGLTQSGKIYIGTLSDMDRMLGRRPARWTRKPTGSPQLAWTGFRLSVPGAATADGVEWEDPSCQEKTVQPGSDTDRNTYGVSAPRDSYQLRFINSLGVHEDCYLQGLRTTEVAIDTDRYVIARKETVTDFSRSVVVKKNDREKWKLSTGPVNDEWQQWYLHEVLLSRWAWLLVAGRWIPCHIVPEETVTGMDRQKASVLEVVFTVELDINGSPL